MSKTTKIIIACIALAALIGITAYLMIASGRPKPLRAVASIEVTGTAAAPKETTSAEATSVAKPKTIDENFEAEIYPAILQFTQASEYTKRGYTRITDQLTAVGVSVDGTTPVLPFVSYYDSEAQLTDLAFGAINIKSGYIKDSDGNYVITTLVMRATSPTAGKSASTIAANLRTLLPSVDSATYATTVRWVLHPAKDRMTAVLRLDTPYWDKNHK